MSILPYDSRILSFGSLEEKMNRGRITEKEKEDHLQEAGQS